MQVPHGEKLRFLLAGGANTLMSMCVYWALLPFVDPRLAYAACFAFGVVSSYSLNSLWVFRRSWTRAGLVSFCIGYGVQALLANGLFSLMLGRTPVPTWLLPVVITILLLPMTFLMNRTLVHRTSPNPESRP
jgi:putative flippase GtrA